MSHFSFIYIEISFNDFRTKLPEKERDAHMCICIEIYFESFIGLVGSTLPPPIWLPRWREGPLILLEEYSDFLCYWFPCVKGCLIHFRPGLHCSCMQRKFVRNKVRFFCFIRNKYGMVVKFVSTRGFRMMCMHQTDLCS